MLISTRGLRTATTGLALGFVATACRDSPSAPLSTLPAGAVPYTAPALYATYWQEVEQCSGLTGDYSRVTWYVVPNTYSFDVQGVAAAGAYYYDRRAIVLSASFLASSKHVRHEELHALLGSPGHPEEYFVTKCGAIVANGSASPDLFPPQSSRGGRNAGEP